MHLTRRYFLQSTGALSAYLGVSPIDVLAMAGDAEPVPVRRRKTLIVIFLRGGADGLNLVVPYGDPAYAALRPSLAIPAPAGGSADGRAIDLDGFFGLHPRLAPLAPLFASELMVATHAVGYDQNTRSHFEEQDVWETGIVGNTVNSDGWVNRHLVTSRGHGRIRAVAIGDALPRIMHGKAPAYSVRGVEDLMLPLRGGDPDVIAAALEHAYCEPREHTGAAHDLLAQTTGATLDGMRELRKVTERPYAPVSPYPNTRLARALLQIARLVKADVGLEVAEVDFGGWDTHRDQGRGAAGLFGNLAGQLAQAMAAFAADMEDRMDDVVVVTLTDFGRTAAENGTRGTDHGWANCMFVMGGPVAGASAAADRDGRSRKVVTRWPGLAPDQLHQGRDLLHTIDFRDVLAELVRVHLGNPNLETILPDHDFERVGLIV